MRFLIAATIFLVASGQTLAGSMESMQAATSLGNIIASEEVCELHYNQEAITAWVEKNISESDMDFPSTLTMMVQGSEYQIKEQSPSARTAHCAQVRRVAKKFGFVQ